MLKDGATRNPTDDEAPVAKRTLPPFSPRRLRQRFALDALMRFGLVAVIGVGVVVIWRYENLSPLATAVVVVGIVASWLWAGTINGRVMQQFEQVMALIEQDPPEAEHLLATLMDNRGLMRWVRLVLYQRMAALRHRQQRFDEAAAIARSVLMYPLGPAEPLRANLLLMLAEANLKRGDAVDAWRALAQLAGMRLPLIEQIQRMALQTQYEVLLGYDAGALHDLDHKIALAELMPPAPCGAWHANIAIAAERAERDDLAAWLRRRAQLLCDPKHWEQLHVGAAESTSF